MLSSNSYFNDHFELLKTAFNLYRISFKQVIFLSLVSAFFISAPFLLGLMHWVVNQTQIVCTFVLSWTLGLILMSTLIFQLYCVAYHFPNSFFQSLRHAIKKILPLVFLSILYLIIVIAGTMILIVPGIILAVSMMFSFILLITDNQNILQTILTSHRLVWDHWWHTAYVISFPILLNVVLTLTAIILLFGVYHFLPFSLTTFNLLGIMIGIALQACLMPFAFSMAIILLHDLRQKSPTQPTW